MIQDSDTFKELYEEIWSSIFSTVKIYYSPRRDACVCITRGEDARFFTSISQAVIWAEGADWIKDAAKVREAAKAAAERLERIDDKRWEQVDACSRLNKQISEADNTSEVARILRRWRDP